MSGAKLPQDPSMEEIIASIGRMIATDAEPAPPAAAAEDEVLELTEALAEDGSLRHIEPAVGPAGRPPSPPLMAAPTEPRLTAPEPRLDAGRLAESRGPGPARLLSEPAAQAAAAAFARLDALPRGDAATELPAGAAGPTLEDIVRQALVPLLQRWLDDHLPALVERLVREEIARLAGDAGRR